MKAIFWVLHKTCHINNLTFTGKSLQKWDRQKKIIPLCWTSKCYKSDCTLSSSEGFQIPPSIALNSRTGLFDHQRFPNPNLKQLCGVKLVLWPISTVQHQTRTPAWSPDRTPGLAPAFPQSGATAEETRMFGIHSFKNVQKTGPSQLLHLPPLLLQADLFAGKINHCQQNFNIENNDNPVA